MTENFHEELKQKLNDQNLFMTHNGVRVTKVTDECAEVELEADQNSLNIYGLLHGGVYFTLADCAAGALARSQGGKYVTLNSSMNFVKSARGGKVIARSNLIHRGRTTCVVHSTVMDEEGTALADATFTMYRIG